MCAVPWVLFVGCALFVVRCVLFVASLLSCVLFFGVVSWRQVLCVGCRLLCVVGYCLVCAALVLAVVCWTWSVVCWLCVDCCLLFVVYCLFAS